MIWGGMCFGFCYVFFSFRNLTGATLVHKENDRTTEKCRKSAKINEISKVSTAQVSQLEFGGREAKPHPKDEVLVKAGTPPTDASVLTSLKPSCGWDPATALVRWVNRRKDFLLSLTVSTGAITEYDQRGTYYLTPATLGVQGTTTSQKDTALD